MAVSTISKNVFFLMGFLILGNQNELYGHKSGEHSERSRL